MEIKRETLDELIAASKGEPLGPQGLRKQPGRALLERMLEGELDHPLGYARHDPAGHGSGNSRNGGSRKTLQGELGERETAAPRDRNGTFAPQVVEKHPARFDGLDDSLLSLHARGMTTRDIQAHVGQAHGV